MQHGSFEIISVRDFLAVFATDGRDLASKSQVQVLHPDKQEEVEAMFKKVVLIACAVLLSGAVVLWVASSGYPRALDAKPEGARITRIDIVDNVDIVDIVSMVPDAPEVQNGLSLFVKDGRILAIDAPDTISMSNDDRVDAESRAAVTLITVAASSSAQTSLWSTARCC